MIKGIKYWNDRTRYVIQTNNAEEAFLKAIKAAGEANHWQESCGPSSATSLVQCMVESEFTFPLPGGGTLQPEDVVFMWMNDPANYLLLQAARPNLVAGTLPGNRVPQYYAPAIAAVFGKVQCHYVEGISWAMVSDAVSKGQGVQLCLFKPGHYIPVVAYDDAADELIFNDTVPDRDGIPGFNRRMKKSDWANVKPFANIFQLIP